jgi:hypothetical protein
MYGIGEKGFLSNISTGSFCLNQFVDSSAPDFPSFYCHGLRAIILKQNNCSRGRMFERNSAALRVGL